MAPLLGVRAGARAGARAPAKPALDRDRDRERAESAQGGGGEAPKAPKVPLCIRKFGGTDRLNPAFEEFYLFYFACVGP